MPSSSTKNSGFDFFSMLLLPLFFTIVSVALNLILVKIGIMDSNVLDPKLPTILDVSLPLVFVTTGAMVTVNSTDDIFLKSGALTPMIACFFILIFIFAVQALSTEMRLIWVQNNLCWFRIIIPDILGAMTIGITIWHLRSG